MGVGVGSASVAIGSGAAQLVRSKTSAIIEIRSFFISRAVRQRICAPFLLSTFKVSNIYYAKCRKNISPRPKIFSCRTQTTGREIPRHGSGKTAVPCRFPCRHPDIISVGSKPRGTKSDSPLPCHFPCIIPEALIREPIHLSQSFRSEAIPYDPTILTIL